jgi:putative transposase
MSPSFGHRRSVRLRGYDYGWQGYYAVTICSQSRQCLFGTIEKGKVLLSDAGKIIEKIWNETPHVRREIRLDAFVIMPNHIHGIVQIKREDGEEEHTSDWMNESEGRTSRAPLPIEGRAYGSRDRQSVSTFVAGFKATTTHQINLLRGSRGFRLWQRSFHEHIIRDEADLCNHREYIMNNPMNWERDQNNPDSII